MATDAAEAEAGAWAKTCRLTGAGTGRHGCSYPSLPSSSSEREAQTLQGRGGGSQCKVGLEHPAQRGGATLPSPLAKPLVLPRGSASPEEEAQGLGQSGRLGQVMAGARASFLVNGHPLVMPVLLHASPLTQ